MSILLNADPFVLSTQHKVDIAVAEGERLLTRFDSIQGRNDLLGLRLQRAVCRLRGQYDQGVVELCLQRLRMAAEQRRYPTEFL
jgi:hypothetical protein